MFIRESSIYCLKFILLINLSKTVDNESLELRGLDEYKFENWWYGFSFDV